MSARKRLTVVLSVVIVGVSGALLFSKENSPLRFWRGRGDDPFAQDVERRVGGPAWQPNQPGTFAPATAAIIQPGAESPAAPTYHQSMRPVGTLLPPIDGVVDTSGAELKPAEAAPGESSSFAHGGQIRHRVEDGDTLTKLAVRYLGRAEAYHRIYEHNRDVLASPDLLPIGAVLIIPQRSAAADTTPFDATQMVPVPPRPVAPR